ncbi:hypothetical protein F5Y15DRAFT_36989 [Xylariaceae sp. FL0016]|nr:hypothetical protein F5Y15DRAFT_36989 [Xylariaceae sp. FL0016]
MEDQRLAPCRMLLQESIPSAVWYEDAVGSYGVPTVLFDLHLIVPDVKKATEILLRNGWLLEEPNKYSFLRPPCSLHFSRLVPPEDPSREKPMYGTTGTVLFSAAEWGVPTEILVEATKSDFLPPLCTVVNHMIGTALDTPEDTPLQRRFFTMLGYLYRYVQDIQGPDFADQLDLEHRQFHLDSVSRRMIRWTIPFFKHERQVRDEIRKGHYELRECSAVRTEENKDLFDNPFDAFKIPVNESLVSDEDEDESDDAEDEDEEEHAMEDQVAELAARK